MAYALSSDATQQRGDHRCSGASVSATDAATYSSAKGCPHTGTKAESVGTRFDHHGAHRNNGSRFDRMNLSSFLSDIARAGQ